MGEHASDSFVSLHVFIINKQNRDNLQEYNKYKMLPFSVLYPLDGEAANCFGVSTSSSGRLGDGSA
jgi:hypothetical protein